MLAILLAAYVAKPVLLPISFALLLSMILYPIHARLVRWLHFPPILSATVILIGLLAGIGWGGANLRQPAIEWLGKLPGSMDQIQKKLQSVPAPVARVGEVASRIDEMAKLPAQAKAATAGAEGKLTNRPAESKTAADPKPVKVEMAGSSGIAQLVVSNVSQFGIHLATTVILVFFMLAYGGVVNQRLAGKSRALAITSEISSSVSVYLFTVTIINAGLGLGVGILMWLLHMPNPVLWGVLAAVLNYVPYLGALVGIITVFIVALLTFDSMGHILAVPLAYFGLASIEGSFITPMVLGNRFTLNPIFIFIWLLFWGWYWGVPGGVIAMPLLMAFKIVCDHFKSLEPVADMISLDPRRRWRILT